MKKIITLTVSTLFISMFLSSCTAKKQHCDAYGQLSVNQSEMNASQENINKITKSEEAF